MSWNVASVMTRDVVTVPPDAPYKEIVERLRERRVSAIPIVDAGGRVRGIVSEADLLLKEEQPAHRPGGHLLDPHGDAARAMARNATALMSAPAVTVAPDATLTEAARLMHRRHVKRLPVVDGGGRLVGIVSRTDLLEPYLRSDESILAEVRDDVAGRALSIDTRTLTVTVADGVVRLEGEVETRSLGGILARLTGSVQGVVGVDDRLTWRLDDTELRSEPSPLALHYSAGERP